MLVAESFHGQRKGLNVGGKTEPLFVIATDVVNNRIYVGQGQSHPGLFRSGLFIKEDEKIDIPILEISEDAEEKQLKAINDLRKNRNNEEVKLALDIFQEDYINYKYSVSTIIAKLDSVVGLGIDRLREIFADFVLVDIDRC